MTEAARVDDPVGHQEVLFGSVVGFAGGIVICALLIAGGIIASPFSGGLSLAATVVGILGLLAICETGAGAGGLIATAWEPTPTGKIKEGARSVFVGPARKPAARVEDAISCEDTTLEKVAIGIILFCVSPAAVVLTPLCTGSHEPTEIAEGSCAVRVEGKLFSRKGDKTLCEGAIAAGEPTVLVFGEAAGPGKPPKVGWVPWAWGWGMSVIEWASFTSAPRRLAKKLLEQGFKKGMKRLIKKEARSFAKSPWARRALKVLGYNDTVGPVVEDVVEHTVGKDSKTSKIYNGQNDVRPTAEKVGEIILKAVKPKR